MTDPGIHRGAHGEVYGVAFDWNKASMRPWPCTVAKLREAVFAAHIVGIDLSSSDTLLPDLARRVTPSQDEVESVEIACLDAIVAGRLIDIGYVPNSVMAFCGRRGGPMFTRGALPLPFRDPWMFCHTWEDGFTAYLAQCQNDDAADFSVEVVELQAVIINDAAVLMINDRASMTLDTDGEYHGQAAPSVWRLLKGGEILNHNKEDPFLSAASSCFDPFLTTLMLLNTRNVERETVRVDDKLNRARKKSGKLPIPPYDRVASADYVTAIQARGQRRETGEGHGGTHASPQPHIRMGHPRHYKDGRATFIRDTLVNVTDEARAAFKSNRSHYEVKS